MNYFDRLDKINNYISEKGRVSTKHLSRTFNVSEQTIRKDLKTLEKDNFIKRIHGGAEKASTFDERLDINVQAKKDLCKVAAKYINDGDIIFIDGGTSYYYLIDYVPKDINITVVTVSLPIAERIKVKSEQNVYLLGGLINGTTLETYSPVATEEISTMMFNKAFFGVSGFSKEYSFTEDNFYSLDFKRKVKENSAQCIVAAGAEKEGKVAFKKAFEFSEIDIFITEETISKEIYKLLIEKLTLIVI